MFDGVEAASSRHSRRLNVAIDNFITTSRVTIHGRRRGTNQPKKHSLRCFSDVKVVAKHKIDFLFLIPFLVKYICFGRLNGQTVPSKYS